MNGPLDRPATMRDVQVAMTDLETFVIKREAALIWKMIALQIALMILMTAALVVVVIYK